MKMMAIGIVLSLLGEVVLAQNAAYRVIEGQTDSNGWPTTSAQICVDSSKAEQCYSPPPKEPLPPFGLKPYAKDLKLPTGTVLIVFTAESWAGGSGSLTSIALLVRRNEGLTNLLPTVDVTNQSEFHIWTVPTVSPMPILVTADFEFREGETHFSRHHYRIASYVYDKQVGRYLKRDEYLTTKMYDGLDASDEIKVLEPEKATIVQRLEKR